MSNKNSNLMNRVLVSILVATAGAIWGAIITREKDPVEELHSTKKSGAWQSKIKPVTCPNCRATNESHEDICFNCGRTLPSPKSPPATKKRAEDDLAAYLEKNWSWLLAVIVLFMLFLFLSSILSVFTAY